MVETPSTMLPLGTEAPRFALPDTADGMRTVAIDDYANAPALLVMFLCNHCPYVIHIREKLVELVRGWQNEGLAAVAISANDVDNYPADGPEKMSELAEQFGFPFPYLYDEDQHVAKAYRAACTPEFFLFDGQRQLVYRGQLDDSRPGNNVPVTGNDLDAAVKAVLAGEPVSGEQKPGIGCNIKWTPGNEPEYFG